MVGAAPAARAAPAASSTRPRGASRARRASPTCARSRAGARRARSSTTPTAPPTPRSGCAARARRSRASSSSRASCATSRRSTRRRRSSAAPPRCRWPSRRPASRACSITRASAPWRAWPSAWASPPACRRSGRRRPRPSRPRRPTTSKWFQLYMWPDRDASAELIAARAGRRLPRAGAHGRRAGGRLAPARRPQRPRLPAAPDAAHAGRHGAAPVVVGQRAHHRAAALRLAEVAADHGRARGEPLRRRARRTPTSAGCASCGTGRWWSRASSPPTTRGASIDLGADGVVVSSHGSRQLDLSPTPLEVLPEIVEAIGDRAEVFLDSGILTGADVVAAVAMGARACLVARAYCYGLMAGGERGVQRAARPAARRDRAHAWRC